MLSFRIFSADGRLGRRAALVAAGLVLAVFSSLFLVLWSSTKAVFRDDVNRLTAGVASDLIEPLRRRQWVDADAVLRGLRWHPEVRFAELVLADGTSVASVGEEKTGGHEHPGEDHDAKGREHDPELDPNCYEVERWIAVDGREQGALRIHADYLPRRRQLAKTYLASVLALTAGAIIVAVPLAQRLSRQFSEPILRLTQTAGLIAERKDYSVRAAATGSPELRAFTGTFNHLLEEIQQRDLALQAARTRLEQQVQALQEEIRLRELSESHRARLVRILDASPNLIASASPDGTLEYLNEAGRRLIGVPDGESVRTLNLESLFPGERLQEWRKAADAGSGAVEVETELVHRDGTRISAAVVRILQGEGTGGAAGVSLVARDLTEQQRAQGEIQRVHHELVAASRRAGMAEIATSVLHNVGNVLNSVNVACTRIRERLDDPRADNLVRTARLVQERRGDLAAFLTDDPRGRVVPGYLEQCAHYLLDRDRSLIEEADSLRRHIEHIREIVKMQQRLSGGSLGVNEEFHPNEVMESALELVGPSLERHDITLHREYSPVGRLTADRHKLVQIVVNLLRNASWAVKTSEGPERTLRVVIRPGAPGSIRFGVTDSGVGISAENLSRIFQHGFTTRPGGHGFGLHASANAAREMGGTLTASSAGVGRGATFTLELPESQKASVT